MSTSGQKEPPLYTIYIYKYNTIYYLSCLYVSISCAFFFTVVRIISCLIHTIFIFHTHSDDLGPNVGPTPKGDPAARALHTHCKGKGHKNSSTFFPGQAAAPLAPPTDAADAPGVPPAAKDGSATASGAAGGASTGGFSGVGRMVFMVFTFARS